MYKKYMGNTESTGCDISTSSHKVVKMSDELTPLMKTNKIKQINDTPVQTGCSVQTGFTTIRLREFEAGFCFIK